MPILVSLQKLVQLEHSETLWPPDLYAFEISLRKEPNERSTWAAIADWLLDNVENEDRLIQACRIVGKRRDLKIVRPTKERSWEQYRIDGLPAMAGYGVRADSFLGCAGKIAEEIDKAMAELEAETPADSELDTRRAVEAAIEAAGAGVDTGEPRGSINP